jgi:hypothetical protein
MAEKLHTLIGKLGPPLVVLLVTALSIVLGVTVYPFGAPPITSAATRLIAAAAPVEQCYAWDVFNGTGLDADGLNVRLTGVQSIASIYAGDANPLGAPRPGGRYDVASGSYLLDLGTNAVTIAAGESVRVGLCSPNVLASARMQWLSGAGALGTVMNLPIVTWRWLSLDVLQVQVQNTAATPMTLLDLRLLSPETHPAVDDLESAGAANLDTAGAGLEEPALLAPNAVLTLRLPLAAEGPAPRAPIAFAVEWAEGDDLAATDTAYIVAGVPDAIRTFLPAISR